MLIPFHAFDAVFLASTSRAIPNFISVKSHDASVDSYSSVIHLDLLAGNGDFDDCLHRMETRMDAQTFHNQFTILKEESLSCAE